MKKRELIYYDFHAPDWLINKATLKETSLVREKDEEADIMLYKFYRKKDLEKGVYQAYCVIFKAKHEWINYYPQKKRWGIAALDNIYEGWSY